MQTRSRRGFTLVEILVVIGIIAILAGLLLAAIQKGRHYVMKSSAQGRMSTLMMAMVDIYHNRNETFMTVFPDTDWDQWYHPTAAMEENATVMDLLGPHDSSLNPNGQGIIKAGDRLTDPWHTPYSLYMDTATGTITLRSWGPDRSWGTMDPEDVPSTPDYSAPPEAADPDEGPEGDDFEVTRTF